MNGAGAITEPLEPPEEKRSSRIRSVFRESVLYKPRHCHCPKREGHLQHPDSAKPHAGKHVKIPYTITSEALLCQSDAKYPRASSARTHTNVHTPEYQKPVCFFLFGQCCCLRLSSERTAAPVDSFTLFFTNLLSICDKVIKFSHRGFCGGRG